MKQIYVASKYILLFFLFLTIRFFAEAQVSLNGKITDSYNHSNLAGATVHIADLNIVAGTDSLGNYKINNIPEGYYLVEVTSIGYATKIESVVIKGITKRDYQLEPSPTQLKEVVVTGVINATDKQHTPISITTMNYDDLLQNSSTNVIDAIAKAPGVSAATDGQSISRI